MRSGRALSAFLLAVGLGFTLLGQFYFAYRREYVRDGVLFWCVGLLAFGLLLRRTTRRAERQRPVRLPWVQKRDLLLYALRSVAAMGGLFCAVLAGRLSCRLPATANFSGVLWLWLFGVYLFLMAFVPALKIREAWSGLLQWLRRNRIELACLAALLLAALAVRGVNLEHIPANLGGDEGIWALGGLAMFEGGRLANPFATRWPSFPDLSFLVWGLSIRIFGESVAGARAISALIGAATVLTTFALARELWGRWVAWPAAVLLAFGHYHLHYSRLASNNIADGFLVTLALALLVRGLRSGRPFHFALAGAALGLSLYGYVGARLVGIIVVVYLVWQARVERRFLARYGWLLALALAAALVVTAPLLLHYVVNPVELTGRVTQVSILAPGWLAHETAYWGVSAAEIYWRQIWKSLTGFHYTLDPTFWYHAAIPLLDFISGMLLVLGLVWAIVHRRQHGNGLLLIWFWLAVITGWVLIENPPSSQRIVIVAPALALLASLGLNWLVEVSRRALGGGRSLWAGATAGLLVAVAAINLHYYFRVYTPTLVYGNPTAEVATVLGRSLAQREEDCVVYFYGPPAMYWDLNNLRFLRRVYAPQIEGMDVPPPGEGEPPRPDLSRRACFVFIPERLGELEAVRAQYPGGTESPVYSQADGRLLYVMYEVSPP